jgi:hypothetical protein
MDKQQRSHRYTKSAKFAGFWVFAGALAFACALLALVVAILWSTRPTPGPIGAATAIIEVTPATRIVTPVITVTPTVTATALVGQAPGDSAEITIGAFVQIGGTGGTGLRLRSEPGLNGEVLLVGLDSEVFRVDDGPVEVDDYTWWYLVGPFDETRRGWAVSDYLSVVQSPQ